MRGDDAAGIAVARALLDKASGYIGPLSMLVLDAGTAPENFTGSLRRFRPDLVLLVDAARMGRAPGKVRWLKAEECGGFGASTHTLPIGMLVNYLLAELGCAVGLVGIQPGRGADPPSGTMADIALSRPVHKAVEAVANEIWKVLTSGRFQSSLTGFAPRENSALTLLPYH